jgi:hypothetical protein
MPALYSVLGQSRPTTAAVTNLLAATSSLGTVISTLSITNTTDTTAQASVYLPVTGVTTAGNDNALLRTVDIFPKSTVALTLGITLENGRSIDVQSSEPGSLTFQAFGSEIS